MLPRLQQRLRRPPTAAPDSVTKPSAKPRQPRDLDPAVAAELLNLYVQFYYAFRKDTADDSPEPAEAAELARPAGITLADLETVKQYVSFLTEAQAQAAAAMRPADPWLPARPARRAAETKAMTAWRQTFSFADQDQEFLRAQWEAAQRSLRALQDRIDQEIRELPANSIGRPAEQTHRRPWPKP